MAALAEAKKKKAARKPDLSLTDHQLSLEMTAARALDVEKRDAFLERVAAQLMRQAGRVSDDDVGKAVERALSAERLQRL